MTEIINGELVHNELTKNANGGTELMARRMVRDIDKSLLEGFQIIHSRVRELDPDLKKILVIHDLANDPEFNKLGDPEYRKQFEKIVFVSNWQLQLFNLVHDVRYSESIVIKNAIEPIEYKAKPNDGIIRLIYHTTPHRGLEILIPVFRELAKKHPEIVLDVYSSFDIYGWGQRDQAYKELLTTSHDRIHFHGFQPNEVIREALQEADIFAYPNIWPETSSIATIEALAAGCVVVCPNLAALPETTANMALLYQWHEDKNQHANIFYLMLDYVINEHKKQPFENRGQVLNTNQVYNWFNVKYEWESLLRQLKG